MVRYLFSICHFLDMNIESHQPLATGGLEPSWNPQPNIHSTQSPPTTVGVTNTKRHMWEKGGGEKKSEQTVTHFSHTWRRSRQKLAEQRPTSTKMYKHCPNTIRNHIKTGRRIFFWTAMCHLSSKRRRRKKQIGCPMCHQWFHPWPSPYCRPSLGARNTMKYNGFVLMCMY